MNDSINVIVEVDFNALLKRFLNHPKVAEYITECYTSYDGFMSSYPNRIPEWAAIAWEKQSHTVGSMLRLLCTGELNEADVWEYSRDSVRIDEFVDYGVLVNLCNENLDLDRVLPSWDCDELEQAKTVKRGT